VAFVCRIPGDGCDIKHQVRTAAPFAEEVRVQTRSTLQLIAILCGLCGASALGAAQAQQLPQLAGTYRCEPDPAACISGQTFTVTQSGGKLEFKNDQGNIGSGTLTSNVSASAGPPWNMFGTVSSDARAIEWTNGTRWRKQ